MTKTTLSALGLKDNNDKETHPLSELWNKIEKHEKRNERAQAKVETLYAQYQDVIAPYDIKTGQMRCAWVRHLLSFLIAKGLKKQAKRELSQVIEGELNRLYEYAFLYDVSEIDALQDEYETCYDQIFKREHQKEVDNSYKYLEHTIKHMFGDDIELPQDEIRKLLISGDEEALDTLLNEVTASFLADNPETAARLEQEEKEEDEWLDFEFNYFDDEKENANKIKELFKGSQLNKMFKRIANVIHPDKETDPLKKEENQKLMQVLAEAKRNNDVITLIKMFSQYVPDADYTLDEATLSSMEHLLKMRVSELNRIHNDIRYKQGFKSMVWMQFNAQSKKKTLAKMQEYIVDAEKTMAQIEQQTAAITNADELNEYVKSALKARKASVLFRI